VHSVVVADDMKEFREGVYEMLRREEDIEIVGHASTGDEAIKVVEAQQPDVVLMDIKMPGVNGIEATHHIVMASPHIRVLVITMYEDDDLVFAAMRAGARGYLLKGADKAEVTRAIRAVVKGEAIFGPGIAHRLMRYFAALPSPSEVVFPELTKREREILTLMAQHLDNNRIASQLGISVKTVLNKVSDILNKLQVADRTEAVILAREKGLGHH
jgi:DNA-binding NarL/FixJ family response regulator